MIIGLLYVFFLFQFWYDNIDISNTSRRGGWTGLGTAKVGCFPLFFFLSHFSPTGSCSNGLPRALINNNKFVRTVVLLCKKVPKTSQGSPSGPSLPQETERGNSFPPGTAPRPGRSSSVLLADSPEKEKAVSRYKGQVQRPLCFRLGALAPSSCHFCGPLAGPL